MRTLVFTLLLASMPYAAAQSQHSEPQEAVSAAAPTSVIDEQLALPAATIYACPMHPHIQQAEPGSCPICGMTLVAKSAALGSSVTVSGAMQQSLGIRTEAAKHRTLWRFIQTYGQVQYPEDAIHHSHIRAEGWIEQLYVRTLGQKVQAGDKLFSFYAPDLLVAQDDYLQALSVTNAGNSRSSTLLKRAETRLRLLGLSEKDILQLQQTKQSQQRITVYAHQEGVVTMLNVRDGMYIKPGDTLIEITSLDKAWLIADVPEAQQSWLKVGMAAELDIPAQHISAIETRVDFIYPALDAQSRSSKVRMTVDNKENYLQPNMLLPVRLYGGALRDVLTIPREAVLLTADSAAPTRLIVQQGDRFSVRQVSTGNSAQGYVEIVAGLMAGEQVVTSGQFLLDAEASLSQLPASQLPVSQPAADSHQH